LRTPSSISLPLCQIKTFSFFTFFSNGGNCFVGFRGDILTGRGFSIGEATSGDRELLLDDFRAGAAALAAGGATTYAVILISYFRCPAAICRPRVLVE
jgi:hypothetical protein